MSKIPFLDPEDLDENERHILDRPINLHRLLANNVALGQPFVDLAAAIRHDGVLDGRLRELAILQVGYLARSPYEVSHHVKIGMDAGLTESDIRAIEADHLGAPHDLGYLERLVLGAAREMSAGLAMTRRTWDALSSHLNNAEMLELGLVIAFYAGVVRVLATFEVDVEPDWSKYLAILPVEDRP